MILVFVGKTMWGMYFVVVELCCISFARLALIAFLNFFIVIGIARNALFLIISLLCLE